MSFGNRIKVPGSKLPYVIYYPHATPPEDRVWDEETTVIASIDPALKNYALRIEERGKTITPLVFTKINLQPYRPDKETVDTSYYNRLREFLLSHLPAFLRCHYVIIERQLPSNYTATRIAQHTITLLSHLLCEQGPLATIVELDPKHKGKMLGYKVKTSGDLKEWAVKKAREILEERRDAESLRIMDEYKKKQDDLADTVIQIQALLLSWGLA